MPEIEYSETRAYGTDSTSTSISYSGAAIENMTYSSHELLSGGGQNVTHDTKGNMPLIPNSLRPNPLAIVWDMDNRMSSADVDNNSTADVTYQFDALGRRVARTANSTTTVYVPSGQQTIADYPSGAASSAPTYRYVFGSYIDEPVLRYQPAGSQSVYYHRSQQFSITALIKAAGTVLERYAYSAYGTPTITNASGTLLTSSGHNNCYTYTGREWDETISLYHYRARMYDPLLGRFCSKDPIGYQDGPSLYQIYFGLSLLDPSGTLKIEVGLSAYWGVGGGMDAEFDLSSEPRGCPEIADGKKKIKIGLWAEVGAESGQRGKLNLLVSPPAGRCNSVQVV